MALGVVRVAKGKVLKKCHRASDIAAVIALLDEDDEMDNPDLQNSEGTVKYLFLNHPTYAMTVYIQYHKIINTRFKLP